MNEEYKEAAFKLVEEILINNNVYSQVYAHILYFYEETLYEYFKNYYDNNSGNIENFLINTDRFPENNRIWREGLEKLKEKYKYE